VTIRDAVRRAGRGEGQGAAPRYRPDPNGPRRPCRPGGGTAFSRTGRQPGVDGSNSSPTASPICHLAIVTLGPPSSFHL